MDRRRQKLVVPGALLVPALASALRRRIGYERSAGLLRAGRLDRTRGPNLVATPRDFRPTDLDAGRAILAGRFASSGGVMDVGAGGDPWDRPSPSRRFAEALHSFEWIQNLLATGEAGAPEALRLFLDWRRQFYRPNRFVWSGEVLERRLYNLACGAKRMGGVASDLEASLLFKAMLHQARYLRHLDEGPARQAERLAVAAIAATSLNGKAAARLAASALAGLGKALSVTVLADGGLRSRSPEAGLELLFDLVTLDDVLLQRGRETPAAISRAIDRLGAALRFFTLGDGRLAAFQGGEAADPHRIRAASNPEEADERPASHAPHSGYHRLSGPNVQVIIDAAAPAEGPWSQAACAQPLAVEVVCGRDRIFANGGWSPRALGPRAFRLAGGANAAELDGRSAGRILTGFLGRALGPRLVDAAGEVAALRNENEAGVWLELAHDGWAGRLGVVHARRLYLNLQADELRGEDAFTPAEPSRTIGAKAFAIRFHAHPDVQVSLARDGRSVLLRGASNRGWWFRNDAPSVTLEPSVVFEGGAPRRTMQVVLRGETTAQGAARVRWKLAPVEPAQPRPSAKTRAAEPVAVLPEALPEREPAQEPEVPPETMAEVAPEIAPEIMPETPSATPAETAPEAEPGAPA